MGNPRRTLAAAAALAAAVGLPALAGVPLREPSGIRIRWDLDTEQPNVKGGEITYFLDPNGSVEEPPGETSHRDAVDAAFATWSEGTGGHLRFREDPLRPAYGRDSEDRVNHVGWEANLFGPYTLAATFASSTNGVLTDADTVFNDTTKFVLWATTTPGTPNYADIQGVATHEIGHLVGLDHSPVLTATMAGVQPVGSIHSRTLAPDDVGGILENYPGRTDPAVGSILGRVKVGRKWARRGAVVVALDARTGEPAASQLTGDDGRYRLLGLPPGPYFVAAAPLATTAGISRWWATSRLDLVPGWRGSVDGDGVVSPEMIFVRGGFASINRDLTVARARAGRPGPGEPDDGPAEARPVVVGGAAVGAFEEGQDEDWFRLETDGINAVDVRVVAWSVGSASDADLAVFAADGTTLLASSVDVRPPVDPENYYGPQGYNLDPAVFGFVAPAPGPVLVRIRAQQNSDTGRPGCFYLLHVATAAGVPDGVRTGVAFVPPSTRAPGGPPVILRVTPRDFRGDPLGAGATITAGRDDGGAPFTLADLGDGTYEGTVLPPSEPGEVGFSLSIDSPLGRGFLADAGTLPVAGPADPARSTLDLAPRRVATGGAGADLVYTPRDSLGRLLGAGLPVSFAFGGAPAGTLGPAADRGDGTYAATLASPDAPGSARVAVVVDGLPTGLSRLVGFGWELDLVAADLGAEAAEVQGIPGLSRNEAVLFGKAAAHLQALAEALAAGSLPDAARLAARAVPPLLAAGDGPGAADGEAAALELAEALRLRVRARIESIFLPSPEPGTVRLLLRVRGLLEKAEARLAAGDTAAGVRLLAAAARRAAPLP
jgi:hypothetical protein